MRESHVLPRTVSWGHGVCLRPSWSFMHCAKVLPRLNCAAGCRQTKVSDCGVTPSARSWQDGAQPDPSPMAALRSQPTPTTAEQRARAQVGWCHVPMERPEVGHGYSKHVYPLTWRGSMALRGLRAKQTPFALDPGEESGGAVGPGLAEYQVAWPFTRLEVGHLEEFIDRWAGWLADAAGGDMRYPSSMPERTPDGTWRRS